MTNAIHWEEMLPDDFIEVRDRCPVCWMAYGLAEPHGAYNALGLDWLKAQALVTRAATAHGGIVAPPMCWHIQERPEFHDDGRGHGWLCECGVKQALASAIPADLFYRMVFHQIRAFDARGFQAAVLVTGHYGGVEKVMRWICEYYLRRTGSPIRLHAIADWECIDAALPYRGDHAGICETSQLMALRPGLTDLTRRTVSHPELGDRYAGVGSFGPEVQPSAAIGEQTVESQVRNLGQVSRDLLAAYRPVPGWQAPNSNETDALWHRFDLATRRYWTGSYQEYKKGLFFQFPGWDALGE